MKMLRLPYFSGQTAVVPAQPAVLRFTSDTANKHCRQVFFSTGSAGCAPLPQFGCHSSHPFVSPLQRFAGIPLSLTNSAYFARVAAT